MDLTDDELAGIVDLFGALTRAELRTALSELAYRRGVEPPGDDRIDAALDAYALFARDPPDDAEGDAAEGELVVAGPAAFPTVPDGGEDLPHIMDVPERDPDRAALGRAALDRLAGVAESDLDDDRRAALIDLTYDVEAWAPVDAGDVRDRLASE